MSPDYTFDRRTADAFERSLLEQEQRHTIMMGTPINPENDTATITFVSAPRVTASYVYDYGYSNCTNWWAPPAKSDEEQKRAWREYWQGFFPSRGTPYRRLRNQLSPVGSIHSAKIPCLKQLRKKAMSPAAKAHRQFIAKLNRPSGFLHVRTF